MCLFCVAAEASPASAPAPDKSSNFIVASFVCPVMFTFMGINVYSYGALVASALYSAFVVFGKDLKRARIDLDDFVCFFTFLAGFGVGSKAHVTLTALSEGKPLTWSAIDLRNGHSFIGSQIGAVGFMLVYIWRKKASVLALLDVLLPCCLLGHCIGKAGCFFSGDGCYGPPADPRNVPWAMSFPNATDPTLVPVHPTPIYEGICSLIVFLVVRGVFPLPQVAEEKEAQKSKSARDDGELEFPKIGRRTALTLVLYGIERVLIEPFRRHPPIVLFGGLTEYQVLGIGLLLIGLVIEFCVRAREESIARQVDVATAKASSSSGSKKKGGETKKKR
eukprot:TRINITY_DN3940_c0_g1_i2.p1 TRINITY_DN3940_c0_g1~~TRINITY_DN3940_c0_g1_i2.p1  ORF type:complete len:334 (-),score=54.40 TRINITY_DN3940_c0_g1_i2:72-1073(-)